MQHAFLSIDTIKGESHDDKHKDWIEIQSFSQDLLQPRSATASTSGGTTAARVNLSPIEITKTIDLATTALNQAASNGTTFPKARIEFMRADKDGNAINYYTVELLNVLVHRVTTTVFRGDAAGSDSVELWCDQVDLPAAEAGRRRWWQGRGAVECNQEHSELRRLM